jgi:hypothetical protein
MISPNDRDSFILSRFWYKDAPTPNFCHLHYLRAVSRFIETRLSNQHRPLTVCMISSMLQSLQLQLVAWHDYLQELTTPLPAFHSTTHNYLTLPNRRRVELLLLYDLNLNLLLWPCQL